MNFDHLILSDQTDRIVYLGRNIIKYILSDETAEPFGYSQDSIDVNDVYIVVLRDTASIDEEDRQAVERIGNISLLKSGGCIVVGSYQNDGAETLIKPIAKDICERRELLNTIYNGSKIAVESECGSSGEVIIRAGKQSVKFSETCEIPAVIIGKNGIKYFTPERKDGSHDKISDILSGGEYKHFLTDQTLTDKRLQADKAIRPEIAEVLQNLKYNEAHTIFTADESKLIIKSIRISDAPKGLKAWAIMTESDVMEGIKEFSQLYTDINEDAKDKHLNGGYTFGLWGDDQKINRIRYLLQKSSNTNTTILLTGESGTGKTYLAKEVHNCSKRHEKAFIHVNCAAIPYNLIESELFGYEAGSFTGAKKGGKPGYFEMAEGGTLFLDEITEMPLQLQGKLLEVIQNKTYFRVGGEKKKTADVRIIAATNKNLQQLVRDHKFREDLFYRINVFPVEIPPLRERIDSLFNIVADLLPAICNRLDIKQLMLSTAALEKMKAYRWPGNIRELENVLEKAAILSDSKMILPEDIAIEQDENRHCLHSLKEQREDFEKSVIERTLKMYKGSKLKTAKHLSIGKTSLFEKIKKYNIEDNDEGGEF